MKPSTFIFLYITVLAGHSIAAPLPIDLSDELEPRMDPPPPPKAPSGPFSRISQYASAKMIGMKINRKFKPAPDEAIFWAGRLPGKDPNNPSTSISMEGHARKVAKDEGKSTLEDHLDKYKIKIPDASKNRHSAKLWEKASKTFANRAQGETHAYLGSYVRPGSVYTNMEKPILMNSPRITRLTEHRVHAGTSEVVKGRKSLSRSRSRSPAGKGKTRARSLSSTRSTASMTRGRTLSRASSPSRSRSLSPTTRGRTLSRGKSPQSRSRSPSRTRSTSRGRPVARAGSRGQSRSPVRSRSKSPARSKSPSPKRKP